LLIERLKANFPNAVHGKTPVRSACPRTHSFLAFPILCHFPLACVGQSNGVYGNARSCRVSSWKCRRRVSRRAVDPVDDWAVNNNQLFSTAR
jgi:hypothetical protein